MQIHFNGQFREIEPGTTVLELVNDLCGQAQGVAVAVNGEVVSAHQLASRTLQERDRVEVIEAVGGG